MVKQLYIKNLFGFYNYEIDFKDEISIISGPNGYGKTTILRIIRDVLEDNLYDLSNIIFDEILMKNDEDVTIRFKKTNNSFYCNNELINIPYEIINDDENTKLYYRRYDDSERSPMLILLSPYDSITYEKNGERFSIVDKVIIADAKIKGGIEKIKYIKDIEEFYVGCRNVFFLGTNRLFDFGGSKKISYMPVHKYNNKNYYAIGNISRDMKALLSSHINEYAKYSANLDSILLLQLSNQIASEKNSLQNYNQENYLADINIIKEKIEKLSKYELLDKREELKIPRKLFVSQYALFFKALASNYKEKLHIFDEIVEKLDLFSNLVNNKLLHKKVFIDAKNGVVVKNENNNNIELNELSSGEQEIIVLYFKLLFEIDDSRTYGLFLIDEPELSLHVEWQYQVVNDLKSIFFARSKESKFKKQLIICTHSPQIIGNHWDNVIELADLNKVQ